MLSILALTVSALSLAISIHLAGKSSRLGRPIDALISSWSAILAALLFFTWLTQ